MSLDKTRNISNQYNRAGERSLNAHINRYDLTPDEKSKIWQAMQEKDQNIMAEKENYQKNWDQRFNTELDRLKGTQKPDFQYNMWGGLQPNDIQLRRQAQSNVLNNHHNRLTAFEKQAEGQINAVLQQAWNDNRGPQKDQIKEQDHNRDQDGDRDRDR